MEHVHVQGMQIVVLALIRSIPPISSVAMFGLFEFIIFAIIGIQLFSGRLGACNQVVSPTPCPPPPPSLCLSYICFPRMPLSTAVRRPGEVWTTSLGFRVRDCPFAAV